jgi:hypothetical protein
VEAGDAVVRDVGTVFDVNRSGDGTGVTQTVGDESGHGAAPSSMASLPFAPAAPRGGGSGTIIA